MKKRVLTGINTTGTLHIGNYVGAIRPAIQDSKNPDVQSFFFMADLHALIKCQDPDRIERSRMQIAATWLAAGLDPERVVFYRQSDIPEIPLLNWMLTCCTSKGQMNRAHAYKAATDAAVAAGMARDVATRFNNLYAKPDESFFVLPQATGGSAIEVLPGLDGRKMSKSYNNVIPLFEGGRKALDEAISRIVTDSRLPGEPKDPDSTSLTVIYDAFATEEESAAFRQELRDGLGWGEAKKRLADKIDTEIGPMRQRYEDLMAHPEQIEAILQQGAARARVYATDLIAKLRYAVGLRSFQKLETASATKAQKKKAPATLFKQYRESDGLFYFKLTHEGSELLVSDGLESGRDAGQWVGRLKKDPASLAEAPVHFAEGVAADNVVALLKSLAED